MSQALANYEIITVQNIADMQGQHQRRLRPAVALLRDRHRRPHRTLGSATSVLAIQAPGPAVRVQILALARMALTAVLMTDSQAEDLVLNLGVPQTRESLSELWSV